MEHINSINVFDCLTDDSINLILSFLTATDLSNFDISLCNKQYRERYLHCVKYVMCLDGRVDASDDYIIWLKSRKIKIQSLRIDIDKFSQISMNEIISDPNYWNQVNSIHFTSDHRTIFTDSFITIFEYLPNLEKIICEDDILVFSDSVMSSIIHSCKHLKHFHLYSNGYQLNSLLNLIHNCNELKELIIESDILTVEDYVRIAESCHNLTYLDFGDMNRSIICDQVLMKICDTCKHLLALKIKFHDQISIESVIRITKSNPKLREIRLFGVRDFDDNLVTNIFTNCQELRELILQEDTRLIESSSNAFCKLSECGLHNHLLSIYLTYRRMSDEDIETISIYCPKLMKFNLHCSSSLTSKSITSLLMNSIHLDSLTISIFIPSSNMSGFNIIGSKTLNIKYIAIYNTILSDSDIIAISLLCPKLRSFNLNGISNVTNASIQSLIVHCNKMKCLVLENCNILTKDLFRDVDSNSFPYLEFLNLTGLQVCDNDVLNIVKHCPKLKYLNLSRINSITSLSVMHIATHGQQLNELLVGYCKGLHDVGDVLSTLVLPKLRRLTITKYHVSDKVVTIISKNNPKLMLRFVYSALDI